MKKLSVVFLNVIALLAAFSHHAKAQMPQNTEVVLTGERFTTSTGSKLERVIYKGFGRAWKTPSGVIWSGVSKETYDNVPIGKNGMNSSTILKSNATERCKAIGGQLPSGADWDDLFRNFEIGEHAFLTSTGIKEFLAVFPGQIGKGLSDGKYFWTTNVSGHAWGPEHADVLVGVAALDYYLGNSFSEKHYIRCIKR